jgi:hypothetical protein
MADIPRAVLSEHFQERMSGRRLRSAVFLTYQFDAGFFEQEVLPVFLDVSLSHAAAIRVVQLEDALRALRGHVAVYYDANGLVLGDAGSAKLDFRRIPVRHRTGIFHPKNAFLLVESEVPDDSGHHRQALLVASLSANLTRSGWWENVEACHVEEIEDGGKTRLKDDVFGFLDGLRRKAPADGEHAALRDILAFLRSTEQRSQKSTEGRLHTHFYSGPGSIPEFLENTAGAHLRGSYLEVIAPYFDDAPDCGPLAELIARFAPREVRIYLPRSQAGAVTCRRELYEAVRTTQGVRWGRLPRDVLKLGRSEDAGDRFVHAKVYRFFTQNPKREICFIGSANMTAPAHQTGGNVETGLLVDIPPARRPEFWLLPEERSPGEFDLRTEYEQPAACGGTPMNLRYHWDRAYAEAFWDTPGAAPELHLSARGVPLGSVQGLPPRAWTRLTPELTCRIGEILAETSLFQVQEGEKTALLLVQEEGMSHKPSLLLRLSASDILKYWALLTPAQRAAFLEARAPEIAVTKEGADLVAKAKITLEPDTLFDRFAGFFHAFSCLERAVRSALEDGREKEASYRLFGKKYDSLGSLLDRMAADAQSGDPVDRYVILLCARQLCQEVARDYAEYWDAHAADAKVLKEKFQALSTVRDALLAQDPERLPAFLEWFDKWFLKRAAAVEEEGQL